MIEEVKNFVLHKLVAMMKEGVVTFEDFRDAIHASEECDDVPHMFITYAVNDVWNTCFIIQHGWMV